MAKRKLTPEFKAEVSLRHSAVKVPKQSSRHNLSEDQLIKVEVPTC